jgi:hypothetical protein
MDAREGKAGLTERQKKWFASVRASLERDTGRSLEQWVEIARACPETTPRARTEWLKREHGLGVNRAAQVLDAAFPSDEPSWDQPEALRAALWKDPAALAVLAAVERLADAEVVVGQRKGYTAFSRDVQFAAMRPLKGGATLLGLKLDPAASPRLKPPARRESWSERLTAVVELAAPAEVDAEIGRLFAAARARG